MQPVMTMRTATILALLALATGGCVAAATPTPVASAPAGSPAPDPTPSEATEPPDPTAEHVVPVPGQQAVLPVPIVELTAQINGRSVAVIAHWASGVEPCFVLDSVAVTPIRDGFAVGLFEGTSRPGVACEAIAVSKSTRIEVGELEPGTYRVRDATGSGTAIEFVVR